VTNLRYIGPHDAVDLDGVGTIVRGEPVSVPTAVAGRKPAKRYLEAMDELVAAMAAINHDDAARLRDEIIELDPGEGLLAQPDNWETVTAKEAAAAVDVQTDLEGDRP
jgi:hypothetical protein